MKSIKKPIHSFYLPQMTASYKFICEQLDEFGIAYEPIKVTAGQLKPMQKDVDMIKVMSLADAKEEDIRPVFVSENLYILDGHHRISGAKYKQGKNAIVRAIRIDADEKDGCAYLKIIQDRWERRTIDTANNK